MARSNQAGRATVAVDYSTATLDPSPESQRILQRWRDEVVAEVYARIAADEVEAEVAAMFEVES